ncbi:hypothetical protein F0562_029976 [Nyssa sinensis]|uniref:tRNA(Ile)-lysidine synthetase n=1 Tax=Nyssa sinensis TaxID=561372 RepID=A0A5J5AVP3_9ASTE|nr:hypothetical protein F0562_029976 [Nyssa sinensis]
MALMQLEDKNNGFIDGLLAIIVDHGLRAESKDEANTVFPPSSGYGCEIAHCEWLDGRPKQGHLQEAARDVSKLFKMFAFNTKLVYLLIAHHADDQAELFILRLSRNSGVLGLAGMAFTSQLFSKYPIFNGEASRDHGILLVRPLLEFSKEDMYTICRGGNQEWLEDPTNRSPLFVRNRIRMSLKNLSSSIFKSELLAVVSACRRTRCYVDQVCCNLINQSVTIIDRGYAVIDLEILNPSKIEDICLSKFVALVLQFISQRHRPVRGGASKLLLDYFRTFPCKTSLTAAGCYLCAAPGSKGTKVLVCCFVDTSFPSKVELFHEHSYEEQKHCILSEFEQIIADGKSYSDQLVLGTSDVHFLDVASSESLLVEAKRRDIISDSTHRSILSLQREEIEHFKSKTEVLSNCKSTEEVESVSISQSKSLEPGQNVYFMNRFLVMYKLSKKIADDPYSLNEANCNPDLGGGSQHYFCMSCLVAHDMVAEVRPMIDSDWLYLAKLKM